MCGIVGIYGVSNAAHMAYLGLYALQHRGQEGTGITVADGNRFFTHKKEGYVSDAYTEKDLQRLAGEIAIGHNRYSTYGESRALNLQPLEIECVHGRIAIAHNGNLTNILELRKRLEDSGAIFLTSSDTEVILHLYARARQAHPAAALCEALRQVQGAFSLVLIAQGRQGTQMIGIRDPHGFRPLCLGRLGDGQWVMASETNAFDLIGADYERDIEPGELVLIDKAGFRSFQAFPADEPTPCVFEEVYFARPDSMVFGGNVYDKRFAMGRQLALEHPAEADVVIPILDSGSVVGQGFAAESKIPLRFGLIRNHYVGRTFIRPRQEHRDSGVKIKHNPVRSVIEGRRVVLTDDSIVRGTTSRRIVQMVRSAGAREIHMRVSGPPTAYPCVYGIDTPRQSELRAANHSIEEIRQYLGVESLGYLSLEGLKKAVGGQPRCMACYTGEYPTHFRFAEVPLERRR